MASRNPSGAEIAVIAVAGRFPGAASVEALWENLTEGRESITFFTDQELRDAGVPEADLANPAYVKASAVLSDVDLFDADFFRVSPREARFLDPQQRLFLECAAEAMERAGYDTSRAPLRVGVFAGASVSTYMLHNLASHPAAWGADRTPIMFGNAGDFLPTRVSYKLDLTGPSVNVQTACSTSLVAVHLACQNLLAGESDMALAGGATVQVPHIAGYHFQPESILSPDGHCRVFDAGARGTLFGSGVGVVLLKRLEDAKRDRDPILAVILGGAMNNDGAGKMGYAAPSIKGQASVIAEALSLADVEPESIGYVEAHGTGTVLGDPIEIAALTQAFGGGGSGVKTCAIGSVKSNVGHLDIAAGITGFIKTVLMLEHGAIPPSLHVDTPNKALDLERTPFEVSTTLRAWPDRGTPRRAGVSSFGIGGTNVHVVIEEAPPCESRVRSTSELFVLSARTPAALERMTERLAAHLAASPGLSLADAAYTLGVGRQRFEERRFFVASCAADAIATLRSGRARTRRSQESEPRLIFMFPGQGSQYAGMAHALMDREESLRADVQRVAEMFERASGRSLWPLLRRLPGDADAAAALDAPEVVQLALFTVGYAMARQLARWGLEPAAVVGHSLGEYVAACIAGVFTLEDAVTAVALRSRLMAETAMGAMLAVPLDEASVRAIVGPNIDVAAVNAPSQVVLSGTPERVASAEAALRARGIEPQRLRVQRANHSSSMDAAAEAFRAGVAKLRLSPPRIPLMSTATGAWLAAREAVDPAHWARQLRHAVRFSDAVTALSDKPGAIFVEVGPGSTLSTLAKQQGVTALAMLPLRSGVEEEHAPLSSLGELWLAGARLDWEGLGGGDRRRVRLPTYPFERTRHWVEPAGHAPRTSAAVEPVHAAPLGPVGAAPSAAEAAVCTLWRGLLGVGHVAVDDDFQALGGDSLLGTQVVSRLRAMFHVDLRVRDLFDAPTPRALARLIESRASVHEVPIERLAPGSAPPLSFAQERLWFLDCLEPESGAYNIASALRLLGELDSRALARAIEHVVGRHDVLRTTFEVDGEGRARAVVHPVATVTLATTPLDGDREERERALHQHARREAAAPFDLGRGPLMRARLLAVAPQEHVLLVTLHHIVADGWSVAILVREVTAAYRALRGGDALSSEALPIQYGDFAAWQRSTLAGAELERQLAHWTSELRGAPAALELPVDRPRPRAPSFEGAHHVRLLSRSASDALDALGRRLGATPFMILFAAYAVLLARHAGQRDLVIGSPIANRTRVETEGLIGMFVNTLALRVDLSGEPTWSELVAQVKARTLAAQAHQDLPFERLVEALAIRRDLGRSPLFQTMFALQNAPQEPIEVSGLRVAPLSVETGVAQFDLAVDAIPTRDGYRLSWEYRTDLFEAATIERMAMRFETLLAGVVDQPECVVWKLPLLPPAEQNDLIHRWNQTATAPLAETTLQALLALQARRRAGAPAVEQGSEVLTYAELDARANALAHHLGTLGPSPVIAVCMRRSIDLVVTLLAVLKSGAAYVPVDPAYPPSRTAFMLADSGARVVATDQALPFPGLEVVFPRDLAARGTAEPPDVICGPTDPAYVLYTSGSTGHPKGVVVEHRAVVGYLSAFGELTELAPSDRVLQFASPSFDVSVEEIFGTLLRGASLVLRTDAMLESVDAFLAAVEEQRITVLDLPTAYWNEVTAALVRGTRLPSCVRLVVLGGERVDLETVRQFRAATSPAVRLLNGYGPTEATIAATFAELVDLQGPDVPIGKPIANTVAYVLDVHGAPSPLGVTGELFLGGLCLARGYLGRPELTAEKFVANPFGPGRLYRTGDRVRRLPSGDLVFVGRDDDQVKVRGFRVELGEIEAALRSLSSVSDVAVVAAGEGGDRRLIAHVIEGERDASGEPALRDRLRALLPEHMLPVVVRVSSLPRLPNGKVDRSALAASAATTADPSLASRYVAPRSEAEHAMCGVWKEVLGVARVGIEDDFFALGGSSLLVIRLSVLAKQRLGLDLPVSAVMNRPTIAALADHPLSTSRLVPLGRIEPNAESIVFVHSLSGEVFPYLEVARRLGGHATYGLRSPIGEGPPICTLEELASVHAESLAELVGPVHLVGWSAGGIIAHEIARQLEVLGRPARTLTLVDPSSPGDDGLAAPSFVAALLSLVGDRSLARVAADADDAVSVAAESLGCDMTTAHLLLDRQLAHHRLVTEHVPSRIGTPTLVISCAARDALTPWIAVAPARPESVAQDHHATLRAEGAAELAIRIERHVAGG